MERPLTEHISPDRTPLSVVQYEQVGGYQAVRKALREMTPEAIRQEVALSTLRGRGGAGFPTGQKWNFMPMGEQARRPKYLAVNADEMEPGTFKDRLLLEGSPHQMVESAIVASYAIEADIAYIFLRREYVEAARRLERAIAEAYEKGYLGRNILGSSYSLEMHLHISAGRYMCGEETGMINAIEGRRAVPRTKPPHPTSVGMWGKPTVANNVETICNVHHIVNRGHAWFKQLARGDDGGTKLYGVSGRVKRPGLWELPMGSTAREILFEHAGGMADGLKFRGLLPGGASTAFLVDEHLDVPLDFTSLAKIGVGLGTGTMIVLDDRTCPVSMLVGLQKFFAQESCGWCTPCREGLPWVEKLLRAIEQGRGTTQDLEMLEIQARLIQPGHTFCALAPGAMESLRTALQYFRKDFEEHISQKQCPYGGGRV